MINLINFVTEMSNFAIIHFALSQVKIKIRLYLFFFFFVFCNENNIKIQFNNFMTERVEIKI